MLYEELSTEIISNFYKVYNTLGFGFLEKVYVNALKYELTKSGINAQKNIKILVRYDSIVVGEYYADLLVEDKIILEIKAIETLVEECEFQLINYLRATNIEVGLLLNFGRKPQIRRKVFDNNKKQSL